MTLRRAQASEHQDQVSVFAQAAIYARTDPRWDLLYAIPNGAKLPFASRRKGDGSTVRYSREATWLLAEGLQVGMPDTHLPLPYPPEERAPEFASLYVELKTPDRLQLTSSQRARFPLLAAHGHLVVVRVGVDNVIRTLEDHLAGRHPWGIERDLRGWDSETGRCSIVRYAPATSTWSTEPRDRQRRG